MGFDFVGHYPADTKAAVNIIGKEALWESLLWYKNPVYLRGGKYPTHCEFHPALLPLL
jgi:hypothetical protein